MSATVRTPPVLPEHVAAHAAGDRRFLSRYAAVVAQAHEGGKDELAMVAPRLFEWITDERNLRVAWDHLAAFGGQAPGPNCWRYGDFTNREKWSLLRCLRDALRAGRYGPGPVRKRRVPKYSGLGFRTLWLQNIEDRVVARAITQIVQPILDPGFDTHSFGFRPGLSRVNALATAEACITCERQTVWVVDDGKDAFDKVPRNRLLDVLKLSLPENVTGLIELVVTTNSRRGIRQGSPLSPLLLNVYLDHFLDRPWRRRHPTEPLIRSADDLLICCGSVGEARRAYHDLEKIMTAAGMPLKGSESTAIVDLSRGESADWLGYSVSYARDDLVCRIADRSWNTLALRLEHAHSKPCSPLVATKIIEGWYEQLGPCYRHEHTDDVLQRVRGIAADLAFDELPTNQELRHRWRSAFDRWNAIRDQTRAAR